MGKKGPLERKKWELMRVLYSSEDVDKEPLKQEISAIREACQQMEYEFIPLNPDSYVSLHLLPVSVRLCLLKNRAIVSEFK